MNRKALAIILTLLSFGAVQETFRIFTSSAPDIAANRLELEIISTVITSILIFFALRSWKKSSEKRL